MLAGQNNIDDDRLDEAARIVKAIDLWDKRTEHPQDLSGGQKQRLALACAFLSSKEIVVLDEPTSGLDFIHMARIAGLIEELSEGRPVAVITHDLELLFKVCTSALMVGRDGCKKVDLRVPGSSESVLRFMGCVR
ncbi:MAG: ATP-binding cassette domain-containing protein [Eggerthella lenta]